jgi:hypothetical protein
MDQGRTWTFRCLSCKAAYMTTTHTNPACPKCGSTSARWLPRGDASAIPAQLGSGEAEPDRRIYHPPVTQTYDDHVMLGIAELGRACFGDRWRRATARALGISDKLLWRWERGLSKPAPYRLRHMLMAAAPHREAIEYASKGGQAVLRRIREPGTSTYGGPYFENRGLGPQKGGALGGPGAYVLDMLPDPRRRGR